MTAIFVSALCILAGCVAGSAGDLDAERMTPRHPAEVHPLVADADREPFEGRDGLQPHGLASPGTSDVGPGPPDATCSNEQEACGDDQDCCDTDSACFEGMCLPAQ